MLKLLLVSWAMLNKDDGDNGWDCYQELPGEVYVCERQCFGTACDVRLEYETPYTKTARVFGDARDLYATYPE